jgi:hypothetical protein
LGPNILLSTLFSNTLILCSSLHIRVHISYKFKTREKISLSKFISWHFQSVYKKPQNILHCREQAFSHLIFF